MERNKNYRPRKHGHPYKLLKYLYDNGTSEGKDAQEGMGLNAYVDGKGRIYYDRASAMFDATIRQLQQRGLVRVLDNDFYELTENGIEFFEHYKVR